MCKEYIDLVERVLREGTPRTDRTGVGTLSLFHHTMHFKLEHGFPLLTTKKMFFPAIKEELLWFLNGSTDSKELASKGIHIWDANGSREALDSLGFRHRERGDLGPIYGFQWRHFGAAYDTCHTNYTDKGTDQIAWIVNEIKSNPTSRRLLLTAWNPADLVTMALPPCHVLAQFYVTNDGRLDCHLYQRSGDVGLGIPFNIASYGLLTHLIAQCCGVVPGTFHHTIGDAHIYKHHVDALKKQTSRNPKPFPKLRLNEKVTDIFAFCGQDIQLEGYEHHSPIAMIMAV